MAGIPGWQQGHCNPFQHLLPGIPRAISILIDENDPAYAGSRDQRELNPAGLTGRHEYRLPWLGNHQAGGNRGFVDGDPEAALVHSVEGDAAIISRDGSAAIVQFSPCR